MPVYTYRREDGTTFEIQQKFLDDPLISCPTTGQKVVRIIQNAGIIFKGSGFYVNDSKGASKKSINGTTSTSPSTDSSTTGSSSSESSAKTSETSTSTSAAS